jgi:hypothetical protein
LEDVSPRFKAEKKQRLFSLIASDSFGDRLVSRHSTRELADAAMRKANKTRKRGVKFSIDFGELVFIPVEVESEDV